MGRTLEFIGTYARWGLAIGVLAAFFLPAMSAALRPWLAPLVALVFIVAMARIDLGEMARRLARPRHLAGLVLWSLVLMAGTPALLWAIGQGADLPEGFTAAMVYTGITPPITSAAALCLLLGLNAVFALELTLVASLLTPLIGPPVAKVLLGEAVPIDALSLALRVGAMVAAGAIGAAILRWVMGAPAIERHARKFDGLSAIVMWLVVVAVLEGAGGRILADPEAALRICALAVVVNFGMQMVAGLTLARPLPAEAGAAGLIWGNRTVALYLAALPFDPVFALYVAFFQLPMLFTPLVMGPFLTRLGRRAHG
ncbi:MAG: hypothetical protein AAGI70_00895 [Pseudomonadota bacterium]